MPHATHTLRLALSLLSSLSLPAGCVGEQTSLPSPSPLPPGPPGPGGFFFLLIGVPR